MSRSKEVKKILRPIQKKVVDLGLGHYGVKGKERKTKDGRVIPNIRTVHDARAAVEKYG